MIAYQVNDSLLAGKGVSLIYSLNNTVTLTYGITGNQSDKLSPDHSVNILAQHSAKSFAQQPAKALADVSAKIYANQSPEFTGNQSGEYFLGCKSGEYLSTPKRGSAKGGEFTPFAKGDFSHLSKEANYPHWQGLIGVTTQGRIEFFESIKKGSQSATLGNVDIEYRASENINTSLLFWYGKYQLLGSMPRLSNSLRRRRLIHPDLLSSPSSFIAVARRSDSSLSSLNCTTWRSLFSFVDIVNSCELICNSVDNVLHCVTFCKAKPDSVVALIGLLITNDNHTIEVTMSKHNTPVTGRTSLTPNQSYRWLFLALNRSDYTAKPCRIAVTAPNENSARLMLVRDYMLIFAGRLPAIGGKHHA
ncbi:host cell division inhibitor Icd-like protein [Providencia vermicola]|uniref:host cell division inhibitor Icd-like protein n=1 Tax=Providencia vermicola TaxID=333965 RepID=UPI0034D45D22